MPASRIAVLLLTGATTVALAACSSSGGGVTPPSAALHSPLAHSVGPVATGDPASSAGNPCTVLPAADVQPLLQPRITGAKSASQTFMTPGDVHECLYATSSSSAELTVGVLAGKNAATIYNGTRGSEGKPTAVPGVGDAAYRGDEDASVTALHGDVLCMVTLTDAGDVPGADRLYEENGHHTDIGAPAFDIIAKAAGTLCNRIFGSGDTTPDLGGLAGVTPPAPTDDGGLPTNPQLPSDFPTS